jgi:isopentenyl diphosphate isomerase/L-lactate dehydrogenase-like FMN-dependent dehydrogenase
MELKAIMDAARKLAGGSCRVCPSCDGRACAGEIPGMGGAGTGASFRRNLEALSSLEFVTRLIHGVKSPALGVEAMGLGLSMPLMAAPVGGISFNLAGAVGEAEYQRAVAEGCRRAGISFGSPDAAADGVFATGLDEGAKALGGNFLPFVKPWAEEEARGRLAAARDAGCRAAAMDLDSVGLATLRVMERPCLPKSLDELARTVSFAHSLGLKFAVKGVMSPEDALAALEAGADGIVVSNHGGRVLDSMPGTADALPAVAAAVGGRATVFCDGGARAGGDVLKMLALGADCVMVGRPFAVAAVGGGAEGVAILASRYRQELENAMVMTGTASVLEVPRSIIRRRSREAWGPGARDQGD